MKIGIVFAMKEELIALKKYVKNIEEKKIFELIFYEGIINNISCILVESGVGKVNAARTTQILIDNYNIHYIFNIGISGGICNDLNVGDIVVGEKLVQHDFDITSFKHEKGYIPNIGVYINSDKKLFDIATKTSLKNIKIKSGVIASGDIFCTDPKMTAKINNKFDALCVEMEGASVAQICYLNKIPFLVIRSISDTPNNDNIITYEEFLEASSNMVADFMYELIKKIK